MSISGRLSTGIATFSTALVIAGLGPILSGCAQASNNPASCDDSRIIAEMQKNADATGADALRRALFMFPTVDFVGLVSITIRGQEVSFDPSIRKRDCVGTASYSVDNVKLNAMSSSIGDTIKQLFLLSVKQAVPSGTFSFEYSVSLNSRGQNVVVDQNNEVSVF